ncbi:MAG: hypothetical protein ACYCR4_13830 [Acidimicrobiales bacterium]
MAHLVQQIYRSRPFSHARDGGSALSPADARAAPVRAGSTTLLVLGVLALLLSIWAGLVPFVGSSFGFAADGTPSWTWDLVHALGALVPGAVGVLACAAMIVVAGGATSGATTTRVLVGAGSLLLACGAWFAAVPVTWPVLVGGYFHAATPSMTLAYWMGLSIGPGMLLAGLASFTIGYAARAPHD